MCVKIFKNSYKFQYCKIVLSAIFFAMLLVISTTLTYYDCTQSNIDNANRPFWIDPDFFKSIQKNLPAHNHKDLLAVVELYSLFEFHKEATSTLRNIIAMLLNEDMDSNMRFTSLLRIARAIPSHNEKYNNIEDEIKSLITTSYSKLKIPTAEQKLAMAEFYYNTGQLASSIIMLKQIDNPPYKQSCLSQLYFKSLRDGNIKFAYSLIALSDEGAWCKLKWMAIFIAQLFEKTFKNSPFLWFCIIFSFGWLTCFSVLCLFKRNIKSCS